MGTILDALKTWTGLAKAAKPAAERVPFPAPSSGQAARWSGPKWFGENIEGYDALMEHSGRVDYDKALGRYTSNSVAAACVSFITTSFCSCPLVVGRVVDGEFVAVPSHPVLDLLVKPGADYGLDLLQPLLLTDFWEWGNAYWAITRPSPSAPPTEIRFMLAGDVEPKPDPTGERLVGEYRYQPTGGAARPYPAENVIHFRFPIPDPTDPRRGARPLAPVVRELYVDNLGSEVSAAIMRCPRPSGILSPDGDSVVTDEDLDAIRRRASELSSNERAGQVLGLSAGIKWTQIAFDPKSLAIDEQRRKPEERICAQFGIPPQVVGIGAGLDRSTYNNAESNKRAAWQDCIGPLQDLIAATLTRALLPMYGDPGDLEIRYDRSAVGVLQADMMAIRTAAREDVKAGIISTEEARAQQGLTGAAPTPPPAPTEPTPPTKSLKQTDAGRIYRVAEQHRNALLRNEERTLSEMAAEYGRLQREIQSALDTLEAAAQGNDLGEMHRYLTQLLPQIEGALADLADRSSAVVADAQRRAIEQATADAIDIARAAAGGPPKAGAVLPWNTLPAESFEALVGLSGNGSPVLGVLQAAGGDYAAAMRDALLYAVGTGQNPRETARALSGLSGANRARMETIARTEMLRAAREATRQTYAANADLLDGYVRVSAQDTRTCPACWALHGKSYPVGDPFAIHPNCRCTLVPAMKSWSDILGIPDLPDTRPTIEDGETLFGRLSAEAQEAILGPGRFDAYQSGAKLADFAQESVDPEWGPTVATRTVADARSRV